MKCKNREPTSQNEFYCLHWAKRCSAMDNRKTCDGFVHMGTTLDDFNLEKELKKHEEDILEEFYV